MLRLLAPLLCLLLFAGCKGDPETIEIPLTVSAPSYNADGNLADLGSEVHYRMQEVPHAQKIPEKQAWKYLGRTPYKGKAELPKSFLQAGGNSIQIRVRKKDYRTVVHTVSQSDVDLTLGIALKANMRSVLLPEE